MTILSINKKLLYFLVYISYWLFFPLKDIYAEGSTAEINVSAKIEPSCLMAIDQNLKFGNYNELKLHTTGAVSVVCTKGTIYTISIDKNKLKNTTKNIKANLDYSLYRDKNRVIVWGNEDNDSISAVGTGAIQSYTIYGEILADQKSVPGEYVDNANIILNINATPISYQLSIKILASAVIN